MLNAHGAGVLTSAARSALKRRFGGNVFSKQRLIRFRPQRVQVTAHPQNDFLWIQPFSRVVGRAEFGTAAALDTAVRLERDQFCDVFARIEAEVFIIRERRNLAETIAARKDRKRAEYQVQMLGVGNEGQKRQNRQGVQPPVDAPTENRPGRGKVPRQAPDRRGSLRRPSRLPLGQGRWRLRGGTLC